MAFAQLPDAATLDRTDAVIRQMSTLALEHPGVANAVAFPGLSVNGFVNASNAGIVFVVLKPSDERRCARAARPRASCRRSTRSSPASRRRSWRSSRRRRCRASAQVGGFKLYVEDRAGLGFEELYQQVQGAIGAGYADAAAGRALLELPGQRAADRRARRSRARQDLRRGADRRVRHAAGLSRVALRQRLQPLRPHLPGERAGGIAVPAAARTDRRAEDAQRRRRDDAARVARSRVRAGPTGPIR